MGLTIGEIYALFSRSRQFIFTRTFTGPELTMGFCLWQQQYCNKSRNICNNLLKSYIKRNLWIYFLLLKFSEIKYIKCHNIYMLNTTYVWWEREREKLIRNRFDKEIYNCFICFFIWIIFLFFLKFFFADNNCIIKNSGKSANKITYIIRNIVWLFIPHFPESKRYPSVMSKWPMLSIQLIIKIVFF